MPELSGAPVVQTLSRLVAWDTVSHRPVTALAGYLAERAESAGMGDLDNSAVVELIRLRTEPPKP